MNLLKIAIGHGLQNYTCANTSATAVAAGALAVLYDVTEMYPLPGKGLPDVAAFNALSGTILHGANIPLNFVNPAAADPNNQLPTTDYLVAGGDPFVAQADLTLGEQTFPFLGHHYFDGTGTPTFDLYARQPADAAFVLRAKKDAAVKAPADADRGLTDSGAVDWLRLSDKGDSEGDVSLVFRVLTAGGSPAACESEDQTESVPYTAMYWFY